MSKKKILYISQEIFPYVSETPLSKQSRKLPQAIQDKGFEVRVFMPRFGCINERRNQLHEVIRLSGMNLIINDSDHPLIIKVASVPSARMQVYFIDNEEYFQRKYQLVDEKGNFYEDNGDRAIFFVRGVLETVKKLNWCPDIIHCQGWMASVVSFFLKTSYKDDPVFSPAKIVTSIHDDEFDVTFDNFGKKLKMDGVTATDIKNIKNANYVDIYSQAILHSDALIQGSETINAEVAKLAKKSGKPFLEFKDEEEYLDAYANVYEDLVSNLVEA